MCNININNFNKNIENLNELLICNKDGITELSEKIIKKLAHKVFCDENYDLFSQTLENLTVLLKMKIKFFIEKEDSKFSVLTNKIVEAYSSMILNKKNKFSKIEVEQNPAFLKDFDFLNCIGELGSLEVLNAIGVYFYQNLKNPIKAIECFEKAGSFGYAPALCSLGSHYYQINDNEKACRYWGIAGSLGNTDALCHLGFYYYQINNIQKTVEYWETAGFFGNTEALLNLGFLYYEIKIDIALEYWELAGYLGHAKSLFNLGCHYFEINDFEKAIEYWIKAESFEDSDKLSDLGACYYNLGYEYHNKYKLCTEKKENYNEQEAQKNIEFALEYFRKASKRGVVEAKQYIKKYFMPML